MPCWVSPPRPSSQRSLLAVTPASRRSRAPRPTRASETALQSTLDAILAELAALQLSGSGGVVNAPAWAGFTTWELVRGSNVVRNLHLEAPLSAALANGDDTLSITADCYSIAAADAALAAALLACYTSSQVDALLGDYRTGTAQDAETTGAISAALLAYYTLAQVDAPLGDYRTASAQDTQTQAAIAGALLAYLDARVCLQVFVLHDMCLCQLKTVCLVWLNSVSAVTNVEFSKVTFNLRVSLLTRLNALNSLMLRPEKQTFCYGAERRNAKSSTLLPAKNHRHQKILPLKLI